MEELETRICERCQQPKPTLDFVGSKRVGPWCNECRELDPKGAKLARDRYLQRQKSHKENHARYLKRKEADTHSNKKKRSEKELQQMAYSLSVEAIRSYKRQARAICLQEGFTKGQIDKTLGWMEEIASMIGDEEKGIE